jgi:hypothetical protein
VLDLVAGAVGKMARGRRERQRRMPCDLVIRELREPPLHVSSAAVEHLAGDAGPQQLTRTLRVSALDRVRDRAVDVAGIGVPGARALMQLGLALRLDAAQLRPEHPRQRRVVPVLAVGAVERNHQDVRPRHVPQHLAGAAAPEDGVAQRARQVLEHRRAPQELPLIVRQPVEQLVADVVRHQPVVAAEARDGAVHVLLAAERLRREVQAGGPPLGALEQHEHVLRRQLDAGEAQHDGRLAARHAQVGRAQVHKPAFGAQAADRQRGLLARGEDELRSLGNRVGDRAQCGHRLRRRQAVDVVQHEHEGLFRAPQRLGESLDVASAIAGDPQMPAAPAGADARVERPRDRGAETPRLVVSIADGHPRDGARVPGQPVDEQHRLAVPGRRDQQRDRHIGGLREAAQEPLASQRAAAQRGQPAGMRSRR